MFGFGRRQKPDLNTISEDIEYIAAAVAWLMQQQQEFNMPNIQQILDEIAQQRSVSNAVVKLIGGLKAALDQARGTESPEQLNGKLHQLSEMIDGSTNELAEAVARCEQQAQADREPQPGDPPPDFSPAQQRQAAAEAAAAAEGGGEVTDESEEGEDEDADEGGSDEPHRRRSSHPARRRR